MLSGNVRVSEQFNASPEEVAGVREYYISSITEDEKLSDYQNLAWPQTNNFSTSSAVIFGASA